MKVIIDTSVWSLFLRRDRRKPRPEVDRLRQHIHQGHAGMLDIVRQELISGIKTEAHFTRLANLLEGFPDILATSEDHRTAARFFIQCRRQDIQGSPVDFLISAIAYRIKAPILTTDRDFSNYAGIIPIRLDDAS